MLLCDALLQVSPELTRPRCMRRLCSVGGVGVCLGDTGPAAPRTCICRSSFQLDFWVQTAMTPCVLCFVPRHGFDANILTPEHSCIPIIWNPNVRETGLPVGHGPYCLHYPWDVAFPVYLLCIWQKDTSPKQICSPVVRWVERRAHRL